MRAFGVAFVGTGAGLGHTQCRDAALLGADGTMLGGGHGCFGRSATGNHVACEADGGTPTSLPPVREARFTGLKK